MNLIEGSRLSYHMNLVNQSSESTAISSHNRNHNARSSNQRARSMFTTPSTTVNHNRNKPPSQQKLCFGSSGFQLGPLRNDAHIAFTPTQSTQNPHIHNEDDLNDAHKLWSVMKKEGTLIFFGCHVCKSHDKHGTLKWSKEQWPVTITIQDVVNRTKQWKAVKDAHNTHAKNGTHLRC
eukprot:926794_1